MERFRGLSFLAFVFLLFASPNFSRADQTADIDQWINNHFHLDGASPWVRWRAEWARDRLTGLTGPLGDQPTEYFAFLRELPILLLLNESDENQLRTRLSQPTFEFTGRVNEAFAHLMSVMGASELLRTGNLRTLQNLSVVQANIIRQGLSSLGFLSYHTSNIHSLIFTRSVGEALSILVELPPTLLRQILRPYSNAQVTALAPAVALRNQIQREILTPMSHLVGRRENFLGDGRGATAQWFELPDTAARNSQAHGTNSSEDSPEQATLNFWRASILDNLRLRWQVQNSDTAGLETSEQRSFPSADNPRAGTGRRAAASLEISAAPPEGLTELPVILDAEPIADDSGQHSATNRDSAEAARLRRMSPEELHRRYTYLGREGGIDHLGPQTRRVLLDNEDNLGAAHGQSRVWGGLSFDPSLLLRASAGAVAVATGAFAFYWYSADFYAYFAEHWEEFCFRLRLFQLKQMGMWTNHGRWPGGL